MRSIEDFFSDLERSQASPSTRLPFNRHNHRSPLPDTVRQVANRGWHIFPVSPLAKATGRPDLLISEATSDISRLEELAVGYSGCDWRVVLGPSSLCILEVDGPQGRDSLTALSREHPECLTLEARRGDAAWAFFRWPTGLALRRSAKKLATGVRILEPSDSCVIPPSRGSCFVNPGADVEAVPCWLRELAFETPDNPAGTTVPMPAPPPRPNPCRSRRLVQTPCHGAQKGYPVHGHAGWRGGFRITRRR